MSSAVLKANDILKNYHGGETIFPYVPNLSITEGVKEIAEKTESFWFLDIIVSYQKKFRNEEFQVWKLSRDYSYSTENNKRIVHKRKNSFVAKCEDGNDNVLLSQKILFSDFKFDEYVVWLQNGIIYLPCEH